MSATRGLLVLDTNVIIHVTRETPHGRLLLEEEGLRSRVDRPLISVVSVGEVLAFSLRNGWQKKKLDRMNELLSELVEVDISPAITRRWAELDTFAKKHGRAIADNDLWIAASAVIADATLITTDNDFEPLQEAGLKVVIYSDREVLPR